MLSSRRGTSASSSSKKMTHGEDALARENTCRTARSLSPTYYQSPVRSRIFIHAEKASESYLVEQLRALDTDKIRPRLVRDRLRQQRLPAPGRAPHEHAARRLDANCAEQLRPADRLHDRHVQLLARRVQRADVRPRHVGHRREPLALRRRLHVLQRARKVGEGDAERRELGLGEWVWMRAEEVHDGVCGRGGGEVEV